MSRRYEWIVLTLYAIAFCLSVLYWIINGGDSEEVMDEQTEHEFISEKVTVPREADTTELDVDELECLALNIYFESRSDSLIGRAAVADVVLNRVEDDYYPDTVCGVVKQSVTHKNWKGNIVPKKYMCQFSWYCDGLSEDIYDTPSWIKALELAETILKNGEWRGVTEQSTHYHAAHVRPNWVSDRGMVYTGTIGQHEFYRWER